MTDTFLDSIESSFSKAGLAFICWTATVLGCAVFGGWLFRSPTGAWVGLLAGLLVIGETLEWFMVSVPEVSGLIVINLLKDGDKALATYDTGIHFKYPWEQVKPGNFINLRQVTEKIEETYPSMDALMDVKWLFQYTPTCKGLPRYISADDNTIKTGLRGIGSSVLAREIAKRTGEECKTEKRKGDDGRIEELPPLEDLLKQALLEKEEDDEEPMLEKAYGIKINRVAIADMDYGEIVQEARSSQERARLVREIAAAYKETHPDISDKDAMNFAFVTAKLAEKKIFDIEGAGPMVQKIISRFRGGQS